MPQSFKTHNKFLCVFATEEEAKASEEQAVEVAESFWMVVWWKTEKMIIFKAERDAFIALKLNG